MQSAALPHAYPFRFVDTVSAPADAAFAGGRVRVRVSANARAAMGQEWGSPILLAEAIAQAALLLEGDDPDRARSGFLAGIENFSAERPPRAGETLEIAVHLAARFGAILRFDGEVLSGTDVLARGSVLVREGTAAAESEPKDGP
jgi:3-hydroxymyristoyl/3-hydroxydecanoyl-(acyl carrier protein) dehydratase